MTITFELNSDGKIIGNKFTDMNVWHLNTWENAPGNLSENYFASRYPYVRRVQLMSATGGETSRDLFINPSDRSTLTDYKLDSLIKACRNLIKQGLVPMIKTGSVPNKFSSEPQNGIFNVNKLPPDDFDAYYDYMKAIGDALVNEFGIDEVKKWTFGVLTEFENSDWFGIPVHNKFDIGGTMNSYFKLYDYTTAALQAAIGAENLNIGAHGMICTVGLWDYANFLNHCASGINYYTGEIGSQINYLTCSYYDYKPGQFNAENLTAVIGNMGAAAKKAGLTNLKFGVDEGRLLGAADGKDLTTREVATSYQGAANARQFKQMIDYDIDWFSAWEFSTSLFGNGIDPVGTHIASLGYTMAEDNYITSRITGTASDQSNTVRGIGGFNSDDKSARFMVFNFNNNPNSTTSESVCIEVKNMELLSNKKVNVTTYYIDDDNANYWTEWWKDQTEAGLNDSDYRSNWSKYSISPLSVLQSDRGRKLWNDNFNKYRELSLLKPVTTEMTVKNGMLTLTPELQHHGVVFYEITESDNSGNEVYESEITFNNDVFTGKKDESVNLNAAYSVTVSSDDPVEFSWQCEDPEALTFGETIIEETDSIKTVSTIAICNKPGEFTVTLTASDGAYGQTVVSIAADDPVYEYILGDINDDKEVNISDAIIIFRSLAGKTELTPEQELSADIDKDGTVAIQDAIYIFRYLADKITFDELQSVISPVPVIEFSY